MLFRSPISFIENTNLNIVGQKRERADPLYQLPSKKTRRDREEGRRSSVVERQLKIEVWRQDSCLGVLDVGPFRRHQRCVFGRAPNADIRLEHASISRQHAKLEVNEAGNVILTDLGSGMQIKCRQSLSD